MTRAPVRAATSAHCSIWSRFSRLHGPAITTTASPPMASEPRSEEHTSELQSLRHLVCRLLLEKNRLAEEQLRDGDIVASTLRSFKRTGPQGVPGPDPQMLRLQRGFSIHSGRTSLFF